MIKAIIIDDEKKAREILLGLITKFCPNIEVVGQAESVDTAEEMVKKHKPDLIFLDVEMPFGNGFDLLDRLKPIDFDVIFTTAYDHYAIKAIRFSALDYLLKPIDPDELKVAIDRVEEKIANKNGIESRIENLLQGLKTNKPKRIAIPSLEGLSLVNVDEIIRCEADANYTRIFMQGGEAILVSKTLKEYEDMLGDYNFVRIHHHNLINMAHVQKYLRGEGGYVILSDNSQVEVSRRKKNEFLERLAQQ